MRRWWGWCGCHCMSGLIKCISFVKKGTVVDWGVGNSMSLEQFQVGLLIICKVLFLWEVLILGGNWFCPEINQSWWLWGCDRAMPMRNMEEIRRKFLQGGIVGVCGVLFEIDPWTRRGAGLPVVTVIINISNDWYGQKVGPLISMAYKSMTNYH